LYNGIFFTNETDFDKITEHAFEIISSHGALIEHESFADIICGYAPDKISYDNKRVKINKNYAREYFMSFRNTAVRERNPTASASAEIYEGPYLDPYDGEFKQWDEKRLLSYIKLAKRLPEVGSVSMLGCPIAGLSLLKKPLLEKLYAFKYGTTGSSAIWDTSLCGKLMDIWEIYANERGVPVSDVFQGGVYMISPLKIGYTESQQVLWFRDRGLKVFIGTLASLGLSAPVTPAGAIAIHIAEQLFLSFVHCALYGEKKFALSCSLSVVDMRTGVFQYGRPEQLLMNTAMSEIADYYGMHFHSHGGLSDAKVPSFEAGVQKLGTALANIMKGRNGNIVAGLLSVDEVYSPVQMVLDNEAAGYLKRICRGFETDDNSLDLEVINDCINESGSFIEQEQTAINVRKCIWTPSVFSGEMLNGWNKKTDIDRARDKAISIIEGPDMEPLISNDCEKKIQNIIDSV